MTDAAPPTFGDGERLVMHSSLHDSFVRAGRMVAFPLCYPGASVPPLADETRTHALDLAEDGGLYIGTGGRKAHLLVGYFTGVTGAVFDLGDIGEATDTVAIACSRDRVVALLNDPTGSLLVTRPLESLPYDLTQEGGFLPQPLVDLGRPLPGEIALAGVRTPSRAWFVGGSSSRLFRLDLASLEFETVESVGAAGGIGVTGDGVVVGFDDDDTLWRFDPSSGSLQRRAIKLPTGHWRDSTCWANGGDLDPVYLADGSGWLHAIEPDGIVRRLAQAPQGPVTAMAATFDGRLLGTCGGAIQTMFSYDPMSAELVDLGIAVSVLQARRYGWSFNAAVVGRDGEVMFGEDDDQAHIWLYFPRVLARRVGRRPERGHPRSSTVRRDVP